MRHIKKVLFGLVALVVFSWLLMTSLVHQAPVGWLVYQAQQGSLGSDWPAEIRRPLLAIDAQAFQGSLGRGQAHNLHLAGVEVARLDWQVSWWRLATLNPVVKLQVGEEPLPWTMRLAINPAGRVTLDVEAGSLEAVQGLPVAFQGRLEGGLRARLDVAQEGISCQSVSGNWQGVARLHGPMQVDLGRVRLEPSCPAADAIAWQVTSQLTNEHRLDLQGQVNAQRWSFTAEAQVHDEAELAPLLQMLGWRRVGTLQEGELAPGQQLEARGGGRF